MTKILKMVQKQDFKRQLEQRYAAIGCKVCDITPVGSIVDPEGVNGISVMVEMNAEQFAAFYGSDVYMRWMSNWEEAGWMPASGSVALYDVWLWHPYNEYRRELTEGDHWKLAKHYLSRFHDLAKTVASDPFYKVYDYNEFWRKYRHHLIAREQLRRQAEANAREVQLLTVEASYFDFSAAE